MARRIDTKLEGLVLVEPDVHGDDRGFFVETFSLDAWKEMGVDADFVQHNHSRSGNGILRGLHFQTSPGQAKLIRCPRGSIFDVADVTYLVSSLYDPETEAGIRWNDPEVGVEWPVAEPQLSARDEVAPLLGEVAAGLPFNY